MTIENTPNENIPNEDVPSEETSAATPPPLPEARETLAELLRRVAKAIWLAVTSEEASRLAKVIELVVVFISLFLIWSQLKQQTDLARAANTQAIANMIFPMNLEFAKNSELTGLMLRGRKGFDTTNVANEIDAERYKSLLATSLIFYENAFSQHEHRLLEDDIYAAWENDLRSFVHDEPLENYWDKWKGLYQEKFRNLVTRFVEEKRARKAKEAGQ